MKTFTGRPYYLRGAKEEGSEVENITCFPSRIAPREKALRDFATEAEARACAQGLVDFKVFSSIEVVQSCGFVCRQKESE